MAWGPGSEQASSAAHATRRSRRVGVRHGRWLVAECLAAIIAVSLLLAYAIPPDPLWIPGMYDDKDDDDVVRMVTDGTGISNSQALQGAVFVVVWFVLHAATGRGQSPTLGRAAVRGPPIEARALLLSASYSIVPPDRHLFSSAPRTR